MIEPAAGVDIRSQFRPDEGGAVPEARNMNAAFLMALAGPDARDSGAARDYLDGMKGGSAGGAFLCGCIDRVLREIGERCHSDAGLLERMDGLDRYISSGQASGDDAGLTDRLWSFFFPEGIVGDVPAAVRALREKRTVTITGMNPSPIASPAREVLFTSNVLLTLPPEGTAAPGADPAVARALDAASGEEQLHWYDHPIPIGAPGESELLHGLKGLSEAVRFEEKAGAMRSGERIDCALSVSVTHPSIRAAARPWVRSELGRAGALPGINLYLFTEDDTERMIDEVLAPAGERYCDAFDEAALRTVFGVDGEYGRHYSFLKAVAALWHVLISPAVRATFKTDLDQVFPQAELARETGSSAFGHLGTPLWGARGVDADGNAVYLGMIAGTLVNRRDAGVSLFTPDVRFPGGAAVADERVFRSAVPQALSTEAEMMTRYAAGGRPDGVESALQRVHVTGGATGILVDALREYRPFTPSCFGRAEDQAYLLSVLCRPGARGLLRYAHEPGLIMRHDSDLFPDAAARAAAGKVLGDYARIILFSEYARALPWDADRTKGAANPFTGCFISPIPITIVLLRFTLRAASLFATDPEEGGRFFLEGVRRLPGILGERANGANPLAGIYEREKKGWDSYYDVLDALERQIACGDPFARKLAERARACVESARV